MKALSEFAQVYLHRLPVDGRKMINGLAAIVQSEMGRVPTGGGLFAFTSKRRDVVKLLYWDRTGFALWIKRLESEKFLWPQKMQADTIELSTQQMAWLLDGYDIARMKPHATLAYSSVI